jgi:hypothetical protein
LLNQVLVVLTSWVRPGRGRVRQFPRNRLARGNCFDSVVHVHSILIGCALDYRMERRVSHLHICRLYRETDSAIVTFSRSGSEDPVRATVLSCEHRRSIEVDQDQHPCGLTRVNPVRIVATE